MPAGPNELWCADIKYVRSWQGWLYLGAVMDCCSRRIVGWSMRPDLGAELVVDALEMAIARRQPKPGLVHQPDEPAQSWSKPTDNPILGEQMPTATPKRSPTRSTPNTAASQSSAKRNQEVEIYDSWHVGDSDYVISEAKSAAEAAATELRESAKKEDQEREYWRCRISPL